MKLRTILCLAATALFLFYSCGIPSPACKGKTKNTGAIEKVLDFSACINPLNENNGEFVVRSRADLDTIACNSTDPVDFSQFSILGKQVTGGCQVKIVSRDVKIDHITKTCTYKITLRECGMCKRLALIQNTVVIPKIPGDYNVIFDVDKK